MSISNKRGRRGIRIFFTWAEIDYMERHTGELIGDAEGTEEEKMNYRIWIKFLRMTIKENAK